MAPPIAEKINEDVFEMYKPDKEPDCEIVFFHGFELGDSRQSYWADWTSADRGQCWPQTWLAEEVPGARVLSVTYDSNLVNGRADMAGIVTKLISSVIQRAEVGQSGCPVILVGHSVGGLVMKGLCAMAGAGLTDANGNPGPVMRCVPLENFLSNVRGLYFYATPHTGSTFFSRKSRAGWKGPLMNDLDVLNEATLCVNEEFSSLRLKYRWSVFGVGETAPTKLGRRLNGLVVSEASSRIGMDQFLSLRFDHIEICKPAGKNSYIFQSFLGFIRRALQQEDITVPDELPDELLNAGPDDWFADPTTWELMVDPVKCTDGRTYDRWTIVDRKLTISPFTREKIVIEFDDVDVKQRLFHEFRGRRELCTARRDKFREQALRGADSKLKYRSMPFLSSKQEAIARLEVVLKWAPSDRQCRQALDSLTGKQPTRVPGNPPPASKIPAVDNRETVLRDQSADSTPLLFGSAVFCFLAYFLSRWAISLSGSEELNG